MLHSSISLKHIPIEILEKSVNMKNEKNFDNEVQKINFPVKWTHFWRHQKLRQDSVNNFMSSI